MSTKPMESPTDRVQHSFKQLANAAQALSSASDDLGRVIRQLNASLKKLNLGITTWVQLSGLSDETQYWISELGYAKVDGKWGIALREATGFHSESEEDSSEMWEFNEAPRQLRTDAVGKIPELLEKLLQQTEEATKDLRAKTAQAAEVATVVSGLVPHVPKAAPQQWNRLGESTPSPAANGAPKLGPGGEAAGAPRPAPSRFRESEALPVERAPMARFREPEALPVERAAPPERPAAPERPAPTPAERPAPGERTV